MPKTTYARIDREMVTTNSSFINVILYSTVDKVLVVRMQGLKSYAYVDVPFVEWYLLEHEDAGGGSVGSYYNQYIRGNYRSVSMDEVQILPAGMSLPNKFKPGDIVRSTFNGVAAVVVDVNGDSIQVQWDGTLEATSLLKGEHFEHINQAS